MNSGTHQLIAQLVRKYVPNQLNMLDYGCGSGLLIPALHNPVKKYVGFDVSSSSLRALKHEHPSGSFTTQYINRDRPLDLGTAGSHNIVVSVGVLQYMSDNQIKDFFAQSHKVLKPGGILLFSCAHSVWYFRLINLYSLLLPHRYFRIQEITGMLNEAGFRVEESFTRGAMVNPLFSYAIACFFDAVDKAIFRSSGVIGPVGTWIRARCKPILDAELQKETGRGYTLFVVARKMK